MSRRPLVLLLGVLSLAGCSVTPPRPELTLPLEPTYSTQVNAKTAALASNWWQDFKDPELDALITRALAENRDLRRIELALSAARARADQAGARLLPEIDLATTGGIRRDDNQTGRFGIPDQSQSFYQAGFDASWELDVFGRLRGLTQAARFDAEAVAHDRDAVQLSLSAEVARLWVAHRGQAALQALRERRLTIVETRQALLQVRQRAGIEADLSVREASADAATLASSLAPLAQTQQALRFSLALLCGTTPGALGSLQAAAVLPAQPAVPTTGLPSELLSRRPDIAAAERRVDVANARLGVAKAELYPRFLISGALATVGEESQSFSLGPGLLYQLAPQIRIPLFNAGRLRAAIRERDSELDQALVAWEGKVLDAVREVETALSGMQQSERQVQGLRTALAQIDQQRQLASIRQDAGIANAFPELAVQERLLALEEQRTLAEVERLTQHIALVKALGGGL